MGDLTHRCPLLPPSTLIPPCPAVPFDPIHTHGSPPFRLFLACMPSKRKHQQEGRQNVRLLRLAPPLLFLLLLSGCSFRAATPTRTPFPTWTPTPLGQQAPPAAPVVQVTETPTLPPPAAAPTETPTSAPPAPAPTDTPVEPPTPAPTDTPAETPTPEPTATPAFSFTLEAAEKFPTDSLAANVVRIYLYVYSPSAYGLAGYTLQVIHNGAALTVDEVSSSGIPEQTRDTPGPYTRFANMSVVFVEPQAGRWEIQLLDPQRAPVGPPVTFDLTADERTRELYVRYREN